MKILAIETSCDDTGIAIIKAGKNGSFKVLSSIVSSQVEIHKKYGGVYPMLAKREHQKNLMPVLKEALKKAKLSYKKPDIDLIAVTNGPGLEPCLWTGVNFAKSLAHSWAVSITPVNHIEAHILVNFLYKKPSFPAICLVVSGGHTQLILMKDIGKYKILGETRDDAAGECFDKTARILGLGYPGGPEIAKQAEKMKEVGLPAGSPTSPKLPRPMINTKDYDFSFSGLKTAVLYDYKNRAEKTKKNREYIKAMAAEIQQAIIDVLLKKTIKAAKDFRAKTIILGGGVSANKELRKQFAKKIKKELPGTEYLMPDASLSTDNALMATMAGYFRYDKRKKQKDIEAEANLRLE